MLRALRIASKKNAIIGATKLRIYKAGTKTYNIVRPKKSKSFEKGRLCPRG